MSVLLLMNLLRKNEQYLLHKGDIRRIDYYPESVFDLKKLIELTGLSQSDVYKSTFANVLYAFGYGTNGEKARLMKNMIRDTLHFCTKCIEEGFGYNLMWKVDGVDCCLKHNQRLSNVCPCCKQEIRYHLIETIDQCPHCNQSLTGTIQGYMNMGIDNIAFQQSLQTNLYQLAQVRNIQFDTQSLAQKLLYLLSGSQPIYRADSVKGKLEGYSLTHLLQYARDSMSSHKTIRLTFILKLLQDKSMDVLSLANLKVPSTFIDSLLEGRSIQWIREFTCRAPWCKAKGRRNSLVSTSSKHAQKSGQKLSHSLICNECFSEYAFDEARNLIERTNFIAAYNIIKQYDVSQMSWPEKQYYFSMGREPIRRAIAYFKARHLMDTGKDQADICMDVSLIENFIFALRRGGKLAEIRYWTLWENYEHYLLHRYHRRVMKEIFDIRYGGKSSIPCVD